MREIWWNNDKHFRWSCVLKKWGDMIIKLLAYKMLTHQPSRPQRKQCDSVRLPLFTYSPSRE